MFLEYDLTFNIKIYKNIALALSPLCKQFVSSSISHLPNLGFKTVMLNTITSNLRKYNIHK